MSAEPHILVPYRASRRGDQALLAAADLADERGARLTVLAAVIDGEHGRRCCGIQGLRWTALLREAAADDLTRARRTLETRTTPVSYELVEGPDFDGIVAAYARDRGCDLTVQTPSVLAALFARSE